MCQGRAGGEKIISVINTLSRHLDSQSCCYYMTGLLPLLSPLATQKKSKYWHAFCPRNKLRFIQGKRRAIALSTPLFDCGKKTGRNIPISRFQFLLFRIHAKKYFMLPLTQAKSIKEKVLFFAEGIRSKNVQNTRLVNCTETKCFCL